jgi:osmotically-inducible protein OsmY
MTRIDSALRRTSLLSRRRISLEAEAGRVVLRGVVQSYFQKQMAQEVIRRVDGVHQVDNQLEVRWENLSTAAREMLP